MTGRRKSGRTRPWVYLLLFGALFAAGCSTGNDSSGLALVDPQGNHPADWISTHPSFAGLGSEMCKSCHGDDLRGGISRVSCFSASFNGQGCHAGGPIQHPLGAAWLDPTVGGVGFHGTQAKADLTVCQVCHGTPGTTLFNGGSAPTSCAACHPAATSHPTDWQGVRVIGPATPPPAAAVITHRTSGNINAACAICHLVTGPGAGPQPGAPSCFSADFTNALGQARACHPGGPPAIHAVPFFDNTHFLATPATFAGNCSNCHADAATSADASPPGCQVCHTAGSPLAVANCTSCHVSPPDGALPGAAYPNIAGAHAVHIGLNTPGNPAGTPISCDTCHNGLGTNTLNHYNRANARTGLDALRVPPGDVAFLATYNAESGASSFDNAALTCLNVSCHGGQTTPPWQTGTLDVNAVSGCTSCHALGTAQFNSYSSGQHAQPIHASSGCLVCHNTTTLSVNHFTALSTAAMEGPASATIGGGSTLVTSYVAGATPGTGSCNALCHPGDRGW